MTPDRARLAEQERLARLLDKRFIYVGTDERRHEEALADAGWLLAEGVALPDGGGEPSVKCPMCGAPCSEPTHTREGRIGLTHYHYLPPVPDAARGPSEAAITKEWCLAMALREGDHEVGAGPRHDYLVHETIEALVSCPLCGAAVRDALNGRPSGGPEPSEAAIKAAREAWIGVPMLPTDIWRERGFDELLRAAGKAMYAVDARRAPPPGAPSEVRRP